MIQRSTRARPSSSGPAACPAAASAGVEAVAGVQKRRQHLAAAGCGVGDARRQAQRHRHPAAAVVAVAAVGVQEAQGVALGGRVGGDLRRLLQQWRRQVLQMAARHQRRQLAGQLPRRKAQHRRRGAAVASQTVAAAGHDIAAARRAGHGQRGATGRRQQRLAGVGVPDVAGKGPAAVGAAFDEAGLRRLAVDRELPPQLRAARELPGVGVAGADGAAFPAAGSAIQRRFFCAPSGHSAYCGAKGCTPRPFRPVSDRRCAASARGAAAASAAASVASSTASAARSCGMTGPHCRPNAAACHRPMEPSAGPPRAMPWCISRRRIPAPRGFRASARMRPATAARRSGNPAARRSAAGAPSHAARPSPPLRQAPACPGCGRAG